MFPAARKGDPVTHDLLVPSGVIGPSITGSGITKTPFGNITESIYKFITYEL
jgi:hypothetical protein